jgi:RimJ/RimL family protein N-acetyltransferase
VEFQPYDNYFWQGEKIRLRPFRAEDALKKCREWTDTEARRFLESQTDLPPLSLAEYTEQMRAGADFKDRSPDRIGFAIETLAGEFVGWINLFIGEPRHGTFSFGLGVFREHQRQGYASEAIRIILRYGFNELRCHKCNSACLASNVASAEMHHKLGFREEGRRRDVSYIGGQYHDELLFGMLKEEYDALYASAQG